MDIKCQYCGKNLATIEGVGRDTFTSKIVFTCRFCGRTTSLNIIRNKRRKNEKEKYGCYRTTR